MKKILVILSALLILGTITACGSDANQDDKSISVGVAFYPMKDILLLIEDDLKADGYSLEIEEFTDYQTANNLLKDSELDANMIQHDYFLQMFNQANNADLVTILPIYHATYALYSKDYTSLDDLPEGSKITMPDDATNLSRALYLMAQADLVTFKDDKKVALTLDDLESNPKNLDFSDQVPLTSLAQRYEETGIAVMYPTYAKSLELEGDDQRLYVEKQDQTTENYAISLVSRSDNQDSEKMTILKKHLQTDKVREFLMREYAWASSPAL